MTAVRLTRKEKQAQTRRAVLDAATKLFALQGVEKTSLEAIAQEARLTQGAIYSNFRSKSELWWAVADELTRTVDLADYLKGDASLHDELAEIGRVTWRVLNEASRTQLLLAQEFDLFLMRHSSERARYLRTIRAGRLELATLLEQRAARRRERLPTDAMRLARAIDAVTDGLVRLFMLDRRAVDEALCVDTLTALAR
jgi:AcrR family transcriptional regulator